MSIQAQSNVFNGVKLDNPADIHKALCKHSKAENVKELTGLLGNKLVRKEIDRDDSGWTALGSAIYTGHGEAALVLLRNGANPLCTIGGGSSVTVYVSKKNDYYSNKLTATEFEALYIAIVANRIFRNDAKTVCELLNSKSPSWSSFNIKKLLTEMELHSQETDQVNDLTKTLTHVLMNVTADESIADINKEEFAAFCKQKSGISILENDKPEQIDLKVPLVTICGQLLISHWKNNFLDILDVKESRGLQFIHEVEGKFAENFHSVFTKLFFADPDETESLILENYTALFSEFLQIYHHHLPAESKEQLETILTNVVEKITKEPVAVGLVMSLTHRMHEMQRDIVDLTATVDDLKNKLVAQDSKMTQIMSALNQGQKTLNNIPTAVGSGLLKD